MVDCEDEVWVTNEVSFSFFQSPCDGQSLSLNWCIISFCFAKMRAATENQFPSSIAAEECRRFVTMTVFLENNKANPLLSPIRHTSCFLVNTKVCESIVDLVADFLLCFFKYFLHFVVPVDGLAFVLGRWF